MKRKRSIFLMVTILFTIMLFSELNASGNPKIYDDAEYYLNKGLSDNQNSEYEETNIYLAGEAGTENNTSSVRTVSSLNWISSRRENTDKDRMLQYLFVSFSIGITFVWLGATKNKEAFTTNWDIYLENNTLDIVDKKDNHINTQLTVEDI